MHVHQIRATSDLAKAFDPSAPSIRTQGNQHRTDAAERPGLTSGEKEELAALRRENRQLREEREILRKAHGSPRPGDEPVKSRLTDEEKAHHDASPTARLLGASQQGCTRGALPGRRRTCARPTARTWDANGSPG